MVGAEVSQLPDFKLTVTQYGITLTLKRSGDALWDQSQGLAGTADTTSSDGSSHHFEVHEAGIASLTYTATDEELSFSQLNWQNYSHVQYVDGQADPTDSYTTPPDNDPMLLNPASFTCGNRTLEMSSQGSSLSFQRIS